MPKNPNPQGKGLTPILETLHAGRALTPVPAKNVEQISNELFTSMFVLQSQFKFKPIVGRQYWLYRRGNEFRLSLIGPDEWNDQEFGQFVGECILQQDITWTLNLDEFASRDDALMLLISERREQFEQDLQAQESIDAALPFYIDSLPFYQRVFASGLAASLNSSMIKGRISGLNYSEALKLSKL